MMNSHGFIVRSNSVQHALEVKQEHGLQLLLEYIKSILSTKYLNIVKINESKYVL